MKTYGFDTETHDPLLTDKGPSWVFGEGEVLVSGLYDASKGTKKSIDGNGGKTVLNIFSSASSALVGAKLSYDLGWVCYENKITARDIKCQLIDVAIAESLIDEYQMFSLDALAQKYLKERKGSEPLVEIALRHGLKGDFRKHLKVLWYGDPARNIPPYKKEIREYVISDADQPVRIWEKQKKILDELGLMPAFEMNMKMVRITLGMKQHGVRIDYAKWQENCTKLSDAYKVINDIFVAKYGEVNFRSPLQMSKLFDDHQIPYKYKLVFKGWAPEDRKFTKDDWFKGDEVWNQRKRLKEFFPNVRVAKGKIILMVPKQYAERTELQAQKLGYQVTCNPSINKFTFEATRATFPIVAEIVELKQASNIIDKFLGPNFERFLVKDANGDYRLHGNFDPVGARQTGRLACLGGDTMVDTPTGRVKIRDVRAGQSVYTHTGAVAVVHALLNQGVKPAYRLTIDESTSIICTEDHKFMAKDWMQAQHCEEVMLVRPKEYIGRRNTLRKNTSSVHRRGKTYASASCSNTGRNVPERTLRSGEKFANRCVSGREGIAILQKQNGTIKSHDREGDGTAPLMEGCGIGQQRAHDHNDGEWKTSVCAQVGVGTSTRCSGRIYSKISRTSYRRKWNEQRTGQPSFSNKEGAPTTSSRMVRVEGFTFVGKVQVFDLILTHEDHSFIANGFAVHNCSKPNLQNIPSKTVLFRKTEKEMNLAKMCREVFLPDRGHIFVKLDFSGQENILQAHFAVGASGDLIRKMYTDNPRLDEHQFVADKSGLQEKYGADIGRKYAKNVRFGLAYGMQNTTMCEQFGWEKEFAEELTAAVKDASPWVPDTMEFIQDMLTGSGAFHGAARRYIKTIVGRRIHLREGMNRDAYKFYNYLIQGSASDMMKLALIAFDESDLVDFINLLLTVHDEGGFSVPPTPQGFAAVLVLQQFFQGAVKLSIPINADPEAGASWAWCEGQDKDEKTKQMKETVEHMLKRVWKDIKAGAKKVPVPAVVEDENYIDFAALADEEDDEEDEE